MKRNAILLVLVILLISSLGVFAVENSEIPENFYFLKPNRHVQIICEGDFFMIQTLSTNEIVVTCRDFVK